MPIWEMPPVDQQPSINLIRWTVVRFKAGDLQADIAYGWDAASSCGRTSSVITSTDHQARSLRTRTGRTYRLLGCPSTDLQGEYVFREKYAGLIKSCEFSDVSSEYQSLAISCALV